MMLMTKTDLHENNAPKRRTKRFRKDEDGAMVIFTLFLFILILTFGGMAVDFMRYETTRAKLQATMDRATLASADLDQILPPEEVCLDYFVKSGMGDHLDSCVLNEGLNFRIVTANASVNMPMLFADLPRIFMSPFTPGVSTLNVSGTSTAEERVTDVEISLVLDVSTSMGRNGRIENLRPAAQEFVTTVLANNTNAPQGLITVSMIPYSAVVNVGTTIESHMPSINRTHEFSTCPLFDDAIFTTTSLNLQGSYDHVAHFDPYWYSSSDDYLSTVQDTDPDRIRYPWCHRGDHNAIVAASTNEGMLHDQIDALVPYGNTAIDMGMKWGVALLDPSTNAVIADLAGAPGTGVPAIASTRPESFDEPDILKVVVLMTDGENTTQYDIDEPLKSGMSNVWFDLDDPDQAVWDVDSDEFSIQYRGEHTEFDYWDDRFYWNRYSSSSRWRSYPNGYSSQWEYVQARQAGEEYIFPKGVGPTYDDIVKRATWQELYAGWVYSDINNELLSRARNHGAISSSEYNAPEDARNTRVVRNWQADNRLSAICAAARAEGIIIYTVAFEAPSAGRQALQDCATSDTHYFDVAGTDISDAFSAIASDIRNLKLTQ